MRRALLGMLLGMLLLAPSAPTVQALPQGIQTLYYSRGVMGRVAHCHMTPGCGVGNYVRGMRLRRDADGMTAVNWQSRWMLSANVVLVVKLYDPVYRVWRGPYRLQVTDYQQQRHSTGNRQRLEVNWEIARAAHFTGNGTTVAQILRIER
jgi:hypothetical protein